MKTNRLFTMEDKLDQTMLELDLKWNYNIVPDTDPIRKRSGYDTYRMSSSMIGSKCKRKIFYDLVHAKTKEFPGRLYRLFNLGHYIEYAMSENLIACGYDFLPLDPETGKQFTYVSKDEFLITKLDGIMVLDGVKTIVEIKSSNTRKYNKVVREGVFNGEYEHFCQMAVSAYLSKIPQSLYIKICKETSKVYCELIDNEALHREIMDVMKHCATVKKHYTLKDMPEPTTSYDCRYCDYKAICRGEEPMKKDCRNCKSFSPALSKCTLTSEFIKYGGLCEKYDSEW